MPGEEELAQASAKTQENVLEGETIVDQDEVAAKLDAAQNHEGHKTGHRLRASS
jgi:hypothetical protein